MSLRPVALPDAVTGALWLGAMPGRFGSWPAFEAQAHRLGLSQVVCLTPRSEMAELSPAYDAAVSAGSVPFRWRQVALRNFGSPQDAAAFRQEVHDLAQALRAGESVMLHCAAGIGRTGTTAACILKALGLPSQEALQRVRDAGSNPQNAEQTGLIDRF